MLLLRSVFGVAILLQGAYYVRQPDATATAWLAGLAALALGALLLFGYMTPIVGSVVLLGAAGIALGLLPPSAPLFDTRLVIAFAVTILVAVILLGPGAFSVDARVYGRREIIVPPVSGIDE